MSHDAFNHCPQCQAFLQTAENARRLFCKHCSFPLTIVARKYRLVERLGEGTTATIYLAHHTGLSEDNERVIKVIKPETLTDEQARLRFQREIQVTIALSRRNEHIVRIYDDFGEEKGLGYYYIMEYLQGRALQDLMYEGEPLGTWLTFRIFFQLSRAIGAAHRAGIVHRDLKPENILLVERDVEPYFLKLIDFGIAKPLRRKLDLVVTHGALGTPAYMSPEQCLNQPVDGRTDIYAMGTLLYELVTGRQPFAQKDDEDERKSMLEMLEIKLSQKPPTMRSVRPDLRIPEGLDRAVLRSLERDPDLRFQRVEDFWSAIAEYAPPAYQQLALASHTALPAVSISQSHAGLPRAENLASFTPPPPSRLPSPGLEDRLARFQRASSSTSLPAVPAVPTPGLESADGRPPVATARSPRRPTALHSYSHNSTGQFESISGTFSAVPAVPASALADGPPEADAKKEKKKRPKKPLASTDEVDLLALDLPDVSEADNQALEPGEQAPDERAPKPDERRLEPGELMPKPDHRGLEPESPASGEHTLARKPEAPVPEAPVSKAPALKPSAPRTHTLEASPLKESATRNQTPYQPIEAITPEQAASVSEASPAPDKATVEVDALPQPAPEARPPEPTEPISADAIPTAPGKLIKAPAQDDDAPAQDDDAPAQDDEDTAVGTKTLPAALQGPAIPSQSSSEAQGSPSPDTTLEFLVQPPEDLPPLDPDSPPPKPLPVRPQNQPSPFSRPSLRPAAMKGNHDTVIQAFSHETEASDDSPQDDVEPSPQERSHASWFKAPK